MAKAKSPKTTKTGRSEHDGQLAQVVQVAQVPLQICIRTAQARQVPASWARYRSVTAGDSASDCHSCCRSRDWPSLPAPESVTVTTSPLRIVYFYTAGKTRTHDLNILLSVDDAIAAQAAKGDGIVGEIDSAGCRTQSTRHQPEKDLEPPMHFVLRGLD